MAMSLKIYSEVYSVAKYYKYNDGWFIYFINTETGEKKYNIEDDDEIVDFKYDDFADENRILSEV